MRQFVRPILTAARRPEPHIPPWGVSLPVLLFVAYFIARVAGSWFAANIRGEDLAAPSELALLWGYLLASVLMVWLVLQFASQALARRAEDQNDPSPPVTTALALTDSQSRPLWLVWLAALAVIIVLDNLALLAGAPGDSLPLPLDRMADASPATWLSAALFFLLIGPAVEQTLLSGMLYPALAGTMADNVRAAAVASVIFAGFYLVQVAGQDFTWHVLYTGVIYPLVLGLTTTLARAHSKSTLGAIGCQTAFGLFLLFKASLLFAG